LSNSKPPALDAVLALVLLRVTLGALFVSTFFENLGKRLNDAAGYAGLIRYYTLQLDQGRFPKAEDGRSLPLARVRRFVM
jgi:hypothetical protein